MTQMIRYAITAGIGAVIAYGSLILTAAPAFQQHRITADMVKAFAPPDQVIVRDLVKYVVCE